MESMELPTRNIHIERKAEEEEEIISTQKNKNRIKLIYASMCEVTAGSITDNRECFDS
jgi:hypothetical protein